MTNGTPRLDKFVAAADTIGGLTPVRVMDVSTTGVATVSWQGSTVPLDPTGTMSWPKLLGFLRSNENQLREIRESVSEPEPDQGWQTNLYSFRRIYVQQRRAVQLVSAATIASLHETNIPAAFADLQAMARMARMEKDDPMLISQMVRIAIASLGLATTWEALQSDGFSDEQLKELQIEWGKVPILNAVELGFVGDRMRTFNLIENARRGDAAFRWDWRSTKAGWRDHISTAIWRASVAQGDEMFYLKSIQSFIEHCRMAENGVPLNDVRKLTQRDHDAIDQAFSEKFARYKYTISAVTIPGFTFATTNCFHWETQRRMTIAAIGIRRYQLRNGKLPESLQALVPEFCSELPIDPMDGKPMRYRINADGTFTLYSIGDNGTDDNGRAERPKGVRNDWPYGLDIVWPTPVSTNGNK